VKIRGSERCARCGINVSLHEAQWEDVDCRGVRVPYCADCQAMVAPGHGWVEGHRFARGIHDEPAA
jgi:hypothetical protein